MYVRQWKPKDHENLTKCKGIFFLKTIFIIALVANELRYLRCFMVILCIILTFLSLGNLPLSRNRSNWNFFSERMLSGSPTCEFKSGEIGHLHDMYKQGNFIRAIESLDLAAPLISISFILHHTNDRVLNLKFEILFNVCGFRSQKPHVTLILSQ